MPPGLAGGGARQAELDGVERAAPSWHDAQVGHRTELPADLPGAFAERRQGLSPTPRQLAEHIGPVRRRREGRPEFAVERGSPQAGVPSMEADGDDDVGIDQ